MCVCVCVRVCVCVLRLWLAPPATILRRGGGPETEAAQSGPKNQAAQRRCKERSTTRADASAGRSCWSQYFSLSLSLLLWLRLDTSNIRFTACARVGTGGSDGGGHG